MNQEQCIRIYDTALDFWSAEYKLGRAPGLDRRFIDAAIAVEGVTESDIRTAISNLLNGAPETITSDGFEAALCLMSHVGGMDDIVEARCRLMLMDGHEWHETIAAQLQWLRDPRAIESLYEAAQKKIDYYYDEGLVFSRRCTWALADIGGEIARDRLRKLAASSNPDIAGFAKKRLDGWDEEMDRKRL